jgi:HK97 family phage major capsid protein
MSATKTPTKTDRLKALLTEVRDLAKTATEAGRDFTAEERADIEAKMNEANTLKADAALEKAIEDFAGDIELIEDGKKATALGGSMPNLAKGKTLGKAFGEHIGDYVKSITTGDGHISKDARVHSPSMGIPGGLKSYGYHQGTGPRTAKALITGASDTSGGALVQEDFVGVVDEGAYARELSVLDVVTRGQTSSDIVTFVREDNFDNQAGVVAEHTDIDTGTTKPQSNFTLEKDSAEVKTIAHWAAVTKQALSDAAQIRTLIDNFLEYGLLEELEDQVLTGDGTGDNFTGLLNTSGVQTIAWDNDLLRTARLAKAAVRVNGRARANAYLMHPNDAAELDLLKDDVGRYYFGGPSDDGVQRLWRLPVVEAEAMPEGTAIVGDFRRAVIYDREQAGIVATDSHADFFIRNIIAILAELRAAFAVHRPAAFATFSTDAAGSS